MKRVLSILAVLCLTFCCFAPALAAKATIIQQPETQTVKAGRDATFTVKARGDTDDGITWYFINPETGETTTGRKLDEVVPGVRVVGPNRLTMKIERVPESMHGWQLYCHIGKKGSGVDTDTVMILISGLEPPANTPVPASVIKAKESGASASTLSTTREEATPTPMVTATPEPIVIKGSKVDLYEMDSKGEVISVLPQHELTFENGKSANFQVRIPQSDTETLQYIAIGKVRLSPEGGEITSLNVRGWPESASVRVKMGNPDDGDGDDLIQARPSATPEPVDESSLVTVTCVNCRFTGWNNSFAESGKVPVGSTITVAANGGLIKKGYSINGEKATHKTEASFDMIVEGDTTIVMEEQK